jgi:hypothetical protein
MPAIIKMSLFNGNPTQTQINALTYSANIASIPKTTQNISLSTGGMIQRIHSVKPGCGSCGRK